MFFFSVLKVLWDAVSELSNGAILFQADVNAKILEEITSSSACLESNRPFLLPQQRLAN